MSRVLSEEHWDKLSKFAKSHRPRKVAIAYVTIDHVSLGEGDELIVDASRCAIASGETNAKVLLALFRKKVIIRSYPGLHAKVALLGSHAYIGSGNMSPNSQKNLTEAGILTEDPSVVSNVTALLDRWSARAKKLEQKDLKALCKIEVRRRPCPQRARGLRVEARVKRRGEGAWLLSISEAAREPVEAAFTTSQEKARAKAKGQPVQWIRYATSVTTFDAKARPGDVAICIDFAQTPAVVYPPSSVVNFTVGKKNKFLWWVPRTQSSMATISVKTLNALLAKIRAKAVTKSTRRSVSGDHLRALTQLWPRKKR